MRTKVKLKFQYDDKKYNVTALLKNPCELMTFVPQPKKNNEDYFDTTDFEDYWALSFFTDEYVFEAQFKPNSYEHTDSYLRVWENDPEGVLIDDVKADIIIK